LASSLGGTACIGVLPASTQDAIMSIKTGQVKTRIMSVRQPFFGEDALSDADR